MNSNAIHFKGADPRRFILKFFRALSSSGVHGSNLFADKETLCHHFSRKEMCSSVRDAFRDVMGAISVRKCDRFKI